jgi:hypothetical protein
MDVNDALWLTVTKVEAAADVLTPLATSLAVIVAVALAAAPAETVNTPAALTVATTVFEELKLSFELGSACIEPSLYVPMTVNCATPFGGNEMLVGCSAIEHNVTAELTVTCVDLAAPVDSPDAESVAVIVAVAPTGAPQIATTTPAELTVATAVLEELKISPEAGRVWVEPTL